MSKRSKRPFTPCTAGWKVRPMLDRLRRQGYGPLAGAPHKGLRAVLHAIASRTDDRSGEGTMTIEQIATAAGYGRRWAREQVYVLEDLGIVEWARGGIMYGRPIPSRFRIVKHVLAGIVNAAADMRTEAMIRHAAETRARLEHIRTIRFVGRRRGKGVGNRSVIAKTPGPNNPRSVHVAVNAYPSSRGEAPKRALPDSVNPSPRINVTPPTVTASRDTLPKGLSGPALARKVLEDLGRLK